MKFAKKSIESLVLPPDRPQLIVWDDEQKGLGLVVGKTKRTFVAQSRNADGKSRRVVLGFYPEMNVAKARAAAQKELGALRVDGRDVNQERRDRKAGPTLADGLTAHVARMRKRGRSEASIADMEREVRKHLADLLDRPITEIDGTELAELHDAIKANAKPRRGAVNAPGAALANRITIYFGAIWTSLNKLHGGKLGTWNPAKAVDRDTIRANRTRIADAALPDWHARVQTMRNPVQRDGLVFALFTGLRSEDVRTVRWDDVDLKARSLRLPDPKGGESRAFTLPLSRTAVEILTRREKENPALFEEAGGDVGWCFPGYDLEGQVVAIPALRETRVTGKTCMPTARTKFRFPAETVHDLRRTYLSVAAEIGISELDQHVLSNHSFGSHNVNATYIAQAFGHLLACQERISAALLERLGAAKKRTTRRSTAGKKTPR